MSFISHLIQLLSRPAADPAIVALYSACVTHARQVEFYRNLGVPDTLDGRFDLLLLHVILIMQRLGDKTKVKQDLFDLMYKDMDRNLRETGVSDMRIGKRMRPLISAFYGRSQVYSHALRVSGDAELSEVLKRNIYGGAPVSEAHIEILTNYVRRAMSALEGQALAEILSGKVEFPFLAH